MNKKPAELFDVELAAERLGPALEAMLEVLFEHREEAVSDQMLREVGMAAVAEVDERGITDRTAANLVMKMQSAGMVRKHAGMVYLTPLGWWWLDAHLVV